MQEQLLSKADQLFRRYGIRSVSMDDIARELGVSKKTLYQLVENKEDLLARILENQQCEEREEMERLQSEAENALDALVKMGRYGARMFSELSPTFLYDMQKYYPALWEQSDRESSRFFVGRMEQNLKRGMAEGFYRSDLQPRVIARLFMHMMMGIFLVEDRFLTDPDQSLVQVFNQTLLYHIYGIATDEGRNSIKDYLAEDERTGGFFRPQP